MTTLLTLLVVCGAPALYVGTGLVLQAWFPHVRMRRSVIPIAGVVFWCGAGLVHLVAGFPRPEFYSFVGATLALAAVLRRHHFLVTLRTERRAFVTWCALYGFGVMALAVSAFPGLWLMGGDWWQHLTMPLAILDGTFGPENLARSPFFAFGALPVLEFGDKVAGYQIYNAVAFAAACWPLVERVLTAERADRTVRGVVLVALAMSPMCTVVLQNLWPKLFAAGLVWLALDRAAIWARTNHPVAAYAGAGWFACATLSHESSILFAPLVLVCACGATERWHVPRWSTLLAAAALGALLVGAWELWTIWKFGVNARYVANPAVTASLGWPWWKKLMLNSIAAVTGFVPSDLVLTWRNSALPAPELAYYSIISVVSTLGATALGTLLPLWWCFRPAFARARSELRSRPRYVRRTLFAGFLAFVGHGLLLGSPPRYGDVQCGLSPFVFLLVGTVLVRLRSSDARGALTFARWWTLVGWLPYVGIGTAVGWLLILRDRYPVWVKKLEEHDGDLVAILVGRANPLAVQPFLLVPAVGAALWLAWWQFTAAERLRSAAA